MCFSNYRGTNAGWLATRFSAMNAHVEWSKPNELMLMWPPGGTSLAGPFFGWCPGTCDPCHMTQLGNSSTQTGCLICVPFLLDSLMRMLFCPCATASQWSLGRAVSTDSCPMKEVSPWVRLLSSFLCETFVLLGVFAAFLNNLSCLSLSCCEQSPLSYCAVFFITNNHTQGEWKLNFMEGNVQGAVTQ